MPIVDIRLFIKLFLLNISLQTGFWYKDFQKGIRFLVKNMVTDVL